MEVDGQGTYVEVDRNMRSEVLAKLLERAANGALKETAQKQGFRALDRSKVFEALRDNLCKMGFLRTIVDVLGREAVLVDAALPVPNATVGERHRDHEVGLGKLLKVMLSTSDQGVGTAFGPSWKSVRTRAVLFDAYLEHASPASPTSRHDRVVLTFAALDDEASCRAAHYGVVAAPKLASRQEHIFVVDAIGAQSTVAPRKRSGVAAPMDGEAAVPPSGAEAPGSSSDSQTVRTPSSQPTQTFRSERPASRRPTTLLLLLLLLLLTTTLLLLLLLHYYSYYSYSSSTSSSSYYYYYNYYCYYYYYYYY